MRYFFISDMHGCEPGLVYLALREKGFIPDQDTVVVLGDIVDRGHYTRQLLTFLLSLPHLIAIKGNHDERDYQLLMGKDYPAIYDKSNGVGATFSSFLGWEPDACKDNKLWLASQLIENDKLANPDLQHNLSNFFYYMRNAVWGIEFPDLIGVHGWLPSKPVEEASYQDWYDATWSDTEACIRLGRFPKKRLIIGHWHAWRLRVALGLGMDVNKYLKPIKDLRTIDFSIYETPNYIAIDGCTIISDVVNVYVYESNVEPLVYTTGAVMPLSQWRADHA